MRIILKNVRIYAYHGVMPQEGMVGDWYIINLQLNIADEQATLTDMLAHTVSYADVYEVVKREMSVPSKLIEHVCGRICHTLLNTFPMVCKVEVSILKQNPPIGADCDGCGVELSVSRQA